MQNIFNNVLCFAYSSCIYANLSCVCKVCTYAKVEKFAPGSDQVQIFILRIVQILHLHVCKSGQCERKAKFAHREYLSNSAKL